MNPKTLLECLVFGALVVGAILAAFVGLTFLLYLYSIGGRVPL